MITYRAHVKLGGSMSRGEVILPTRNTFSVYLQALSFYNVTMGTVLCCERKQISYEVKGQVSI